MIDIRRGIVRITAAKERGTGFLVLDANNGPCILTAMHIVANIDASIATNRPHWLAPSATITFHEQSSLCVELAAVTQTNAQEDWVLLRLQAEHVENIPADARPLTLTQLDDASAAPHWKTHGFSKVDARNGSPIGGIVRTEENGELALFCHELHMSEEDLAAGYSGAPCIWEGMVVGIITQALQNARGQCVFGRLYAMPVVSIARCCNLPLESDEEPFEREVAAALHQLPRQSLSGVATALNINPKATADVLLGRTARAALRASSAELCNAISQYVHHLPNPQAIAEMSIAQKLSRQAVEVLQCLQQRKPLCVAAVARKESAKMLVARALNRYLSLIHI